MPKHADYAADIITHGFSATIPTKPNSWRVRLYDTADCVGELTYGNYAAVEVKGIGVVDSFPAWVASGGTDAVENDANLDFGENNSGGQLSVNSVGITDASVTPNIYYYTNITLTYIEANDEPRIALGDLVITES